MRSTIGTKSFPIVLKVKAQAVPSEKWSLPLHTMLKMFSRKDMLKNSTKGEGKHKPSLGEQSISKGIEGKKKILVLEI